MTVYLTVNLQLTTRYLVEPVISSNMLKIASKIDQFTIFYSMNFGNSILSLHF